MHVILSDQSESKDLRFAWASLRFSTVPLIFRTDTHSDTGGQPQILRLRLPRRTPLWDDTLVLEYFDEFTEQNTHKLLGDICGVCAFQAEACAD
jgi:hypothetical protein